MVNNFKWSKNIGGIIYFFIFAVFVLTTFSIFPLDDDWIYYTSPNTTFSIDDLLPTESFWRPFDVIFGYLIGKFPYAFPVVNHIAVAFAHVLSAKLIEKITKLMGYSKSARIFSVAFFLFSPAIWATLVSPDGLNQAFSLLFGVVSCFCFLNNRKVLYIIFVVLAMLWKESGVSFFAVAPLLGVVNNIHCDNTSEIKKAVLFLIKYALLAIFVIMLYFSFRFALAGSIQLGHSDGRYSVSILSLNTAKNTVILVLFASTFMDTISVFLGAITDLPFVITFPLNIVFLFMMCIALFRNAGKSVIIKYILFLVIMFVLAFPQAIIVSVGELHAYPVLFGVGLLYGCIYDNICTNKTLVTNALLVCSSVCFLMVGAHKLDMIYKYSAETKEFTKRLYEEGARDCESICIITTPIEAGYSVFYQPPIVGAGYGNCLKLYNGWKNINQCVETVNSFDDIADICNKNFDLYEHIVFVDGDDINVIK